MPPTATAVDLFAGPGGLDEGARQAAPDLAVLGVEYDKHACATRRAAGHHTLQADVAYLKPRSIERCTGPLDGLLGSPPCTPFTRAGRGKGREHLPALAAAIDDVAVGDDDARRRFDKTTALVLEPVRWVRELMPRWVVLEQVADVLPVWQAAGRALERLGYWTWAGVLNAADYGVPQARKRAVLIARRWHDGPVVAPAPTHAAGGARGLLPWVTMAEALGLTADDLEPGQRWALDRPSPTIVGSFHPEVVAAPGWRKPGDRPRQHTPGSIVVTEAQAARLQAFPDGYPFAGPKTARWQQIGNAVPPRLAAHVIAATGG